MDRCLIGGMLLVLASVACQTVDPLDSPAYQQLAEDKARVKEALAQAEEREEEANQRAEDLEERLADLEADLRQLRGTARELTERASHQAAAIHALAAEVDPFVRTCETRVYGSLEEGWREEAVVVGPIAFTHLPFYADPSQADALQPQEGSRYWSQKVLVVVEKGAVGTVVVPPDERTNVSLEYDPAIRSHDGLYEVSDGDPAVTFLACPGTRTQFNGGFIVAGARCVPLHIYVNGNTEPTRIWASFAAGSCAGGQ